MSNIPDLLLVTALIAFLALCITVLLMIRFSRNRDAAVNRAFNLFVELIRAIADVLKQWLRPK